MTPEFPLRIISNDGDCEVVGSPEDLVARIDSIEAGAIDSSVWIRDALDRTVHLRMRNGMIEVFELLP